MRIKVFVQDDDFYFIEINLIYLNYNPRNLKYSMSAGGYDICGGRLPRPTSIEYDDGIQKIVFSNVGEALQFFEWVRDAYSRARDSFSTMMD